MKRVLYLVNCAAALFGSLTAMLVAVLVAQPAQSADCVSLTAAQTVYTAPALTGTSTTTNPDCYTFDLEQPDVLLVIVDKPTDQAHRIYVKDPEGNFLCGSNEKCSLSEPGTVQIRFGAVGPYQVRVVLLSGGCPPIALARFGPANDYDQATVGAGVIDCRQLTLIPGNYLLNSGGPGDSDIIGSTGRSHCESEALCVIPSNGTYFLLRNNPRGNPVAYRTKVIPLTDSTSCASKVLDNSWRSPMTVFETDALHVQCGTLKAEAGSYVVPRSRTFKGGEFSIYLVDALGNTLCDQGAICHLTGVAPFRMIVDLDQRSPATTLAVSASQVGAGSDCPRLPVSSFGSVAEDADVNVLCRTFDGTAGHQLAITTFSPTEKSPVDISVYDEQLNEVCPNLEGRQIFCQLPNSGVYTVLSSVPNSIRMHNVNVGTGCQQLPLAIAMRPVSLAVRQVKCVEVQTHGQAEIGIASDWIDQDENINVTVFDSTGQTVCLLWGSDQQSTEACPLTGAPPYRAVIGRGQAQSGRVGFFDTADPSCPDVATPGNDAVKFAKNEFLKCVMVPVSMRANPEWMRLQRTSGTGKATLSAFISGVSPWRSRQPEVSPTALLARDAFKPAYVVFVTDAVGTYKFLQRADDGTTPNWVKPSITGVMKPGNRVSAVPGEWAFGKTESVRLTYRWLLDGTVISGATGKTLVLTAGYRGKKLTVEVTAKADGLRPGVAVSSARKVL